MDIRITGKDYMEEMLRLQSRVKELEGINRERLGKIIKSGVEIVELKARVKELEDAIEKHRELVGTHHSLPDDFLYVVLAKPLTDKDKCQDPARDKIPANDHKCK